MNVHWYMLHVMANEIARQLMPEKATTIIYTCENCGRDFTVAQDDDPHGPDGVVWCPDCKPEY